ncbi:MAG: nitric oxide-sensing protein NosP [Acidimicrobiales bacterium]
MNEPASLVAEPRSGQAPQHHHHTNESQDLIILKGASTSPDPVVAVAELYEAIYHPDAALTIIYCSPSYDLDQLAAELHQRFAGTNMVGATTAGEITPIGYLDGALTGVTLAGPAIRAESTRIDVLEHFNFASGDDAAARLLQRVGEREPATGANTFAFLLVDGLSRQEEMLVAALYRSLGEIQLFGGSAGDGTRFDTTYIYHDGAFRAGSAVFTLVQTSLPFEVFKTEHFVATDKKMVVTEAIASERIVTEINGEPAAREYARAVGVPVDTLNPLSFATHPVVVTVGDVTYVRSIQKVNPDESLTFFCAIDVGIVLTIARGVDMVANLREAFEGITRRLGPPTLVLGCDCILRNIEAKQRGLIPEIGRLMQDNNVIGFATYGEQFNGMHANQTFTGVAIGAGG